MSRDNHRDDVFSKALLAKITDNAKWRARTTKASFIEQQKRSLLNERTVNVKIPQLKKIQKTTTPKQCLLHGPLHNLK